MAGDYYVAPGGSDKNPGTKDKPFETIQQAASVMQAGDRCLIRAGTYRETVTPANSGKDKAPIIFEAFESEKVTISGADVVAGPWQQHEGEIRKAAMLWTLGAGRDMVFVNGKVVIQARHPNTDTAPRKLPALGLPPLWMTFGNFTTTMDSPELTNPTDLNQEQADYWKGALYVGWHGWGWCTQSARITASRKGAITFEQISGWWFPHGFPKDADVGKEYHQGYLTDHIHALDTAGEWHHQDGKLYLWPPKGVDFLKSVVEAKRRHLAFDLRRRDHIVLKGLRIVAASVTMDEANHCVIDGCRMSFVSHYTVFKDARDGYIDGRNEGNTKGAPQRGEVGIYIGGKDNVIKNSVVKYSAGAGLFLAGYRTTVTNSIIHNCGYAGTYVGGIFITFDPAMAEVSAESVRGGHSITYNEISRAGRAVIQISSVTGPEKPTVYDAMDIGYNRIHDGCITGHDGGLIYCFAASLGTGDKRAQVHHNLCWDLHGYFWQGLLYPDGEGVDKIDYHDNVLWQTRVAREALFYKNNGTLDPKYFNNTEKTNYDGGVEGLTDADYPGGKVFRTGPTIKDEVDEWFDYPWSK